MNKIIRTILSEINFYKIQIKGKCKYLTEESYNKPHCLNKTVGIKSKCEDCSLENKAIKVKLNDKLIDKIMHDNKFKNIEELFHTDFSKTHGISKLKNQFLKEYLNLIKDDYIHLFPENSSYLNMKRKEVYKSKCAKKIFKSERLI